MGDQFVLQTTEEQILQRTRELRTKLEAEAHIKKEEARVENQKKAVQNRKKAEQKQINDHQKLLEKFARKRLLLSKDEIGKFSSEEIIVLDSMITSRAKCTARLFYAVHAAIATTIVGSAILWSPGFLFLYMLQALFFFFGRFGNTEEGWRVGQYFIFLDTRARWLQEHTPQLDEKRREGG